MGVLNVIDRLLAVARGDAAADVLLTGGRVVDVFTGTVIKANVAVADGLIASVGPVREAVEAVDLAGRFLVPGLIDSHVHLESSMVTPFEFARAVVPRGTTAVVTDPHEVANVAGLVGVQWLLAASEGLPLAVLVMAPSCVPATHLATAGAELDAEDLEVLAQHPRVIGLAEVMNIPGVVLGDPAVHAKINAFEGLPVDGHGPGLAGDWLQAYAAAGVGTDHETLTPEEAQEKLRLGMRVWLREGTGARNLLDLLPVVTPATSRRCGFCTDDRHPHDLLDEGHIDHLLRLAIANGLDPMTAIQMATLNIAEAYGLDDRGAIAPGRRADLVVCDDLADFRAAQVFVGGDVVAENGQVVGSWPEPSADPAAVLRSPVVDLEALDLRIEDSGADVRVIGLVPGQIVTEHLIEGLAAQDGHLVADPEAGLAKLAVIERHRGTGNVGLGFLRGLGPLQGALACTIAHDHHNLIVAGGDDGSMRTAIAEVVRLGGGAVVARGGEVLAGLPLPYAGLISERPLVEVRGQLDELAAAARRCGCDHPDPVMALSFVALEVIPSLKLTDRGLVDVEKFELVSLAVEG
ncbi:MAG: adenine deaminase [Acidobacteria bacterium]|uniref:Adenine deaminase n=1 Tax=Candidatus Sulfomarinibacter kjeldsenii TaxID=2885994 RepID=A0A8J6Y499_9BACT|nr:adenine deaminase [Candidatus Sulfomarinibacter kjeldsenii]